jgi:cellulose synthase/poly-beta-1,6-N-acetylglucosamine synthase-like glycosyltransferase
VGDLNWLLLLSGIMAFLLGLGHFRRSFGIAHLLQAAAPHTEAALTSLPPVSVLAPCCGVDHAFEAYARALLSQDYPRYEVLFVVASTADPAWEALSRILATTPGANASLLVAGTAEGCSQKLHSLRVGLAHVETKTTILAFVDSDVQVHAQWLQALVEPLDAPRIGATSGFRWYIPCRGSVVSSLRSAWNAATLGLMVHPRFGFAWGGSSAIRRDLFDKLDIGAAWSRGLSDDLLLTRAVRAADLRIAFVAAGLVPTYEPCTWSQLLEWTNRQATIARVYMPPSWGISLLVHFSTIGLGLLLLLALSTGHWLTGGLLMSQGLLNGLGSMVVCRAALHRLSLSGYTVRQSVWAQALWGPAVTSLASFNIVAALTRRTITWRGITYSMLSPQHTVVRHRRGVVASPSHPS